MGARRVGLLEKAAGASMALKSAEPTQLSHHMEPTQLSHPMEPTQLPHPEEAPLGAVSKGAPHRPQSFIPWSPPNSLILRRPLLGPSRRTHPAAPSLPARPGWDQIGWRIKCTVTEFSCEVDGRACLSDVRAADRAPGREVGRV
jgi:hypothetical protein